MSKAKKSGANEKNFGERIKKMLSDQRMLEMNIIKQFVKLKKFVGKSFFKEKKMEHHPILFNEVIKIDIRQH